MTKRIERPYWGIPFYLYLAANYVRFFSGGTCLRFPFSLNIQSKSLCNGRCSICPYPKVSRHFDQGAMEWDLFSRIIDQAASEPLLSRIVF
jgi:sulfatase maturation enzyme AslB (radical SAM superfamily)